LLKNSTALEGVSSVFSKLCLGCWFNPDLKIFADIIMFVTGKMMFIMTLIFLFENLEQLQLFCGHGPRKRSYAGFVIFSVSHLGVAETHNREMVQSCMILPFHFV
jgi:hypothetical protein